MYTARYLHASYRGRKEVIDWIKLFIIPRLLMIVLSRIFSMHGNALIHCIKFCAISIMAMLQFS